MKNNAKNLATVIILALFSLSSQQVFAFSSGISGYSGNPATNGGNTCTACHSGGAAPTIAITGPSVVAPNSVNDYTLTITGGQSNSGGLDVSASSGTLINKATTTKLQAGEITHTSRTTAAGGSVSWTFTWQAPSALGAYTLFGASVSSNANSNTTGDGVATTQSTVTVSSAAPQPPTAVIRAPLTATVGATVTFDGSASYDSDGNVVSFEWNFGDGHTATGALAVNTFTAAGLYKVTLTVTDNGGQTNTTFLDIQVGGTMIPVANVGGPYTGSPGQAVSFNASQSTHTLPIVRYIWDFGDGSALVSTTVPTVSHTYATVGSYTLTLAVQDANNITGFTSTAVVISSATPPPPPVTDGATLYGTYCSGCHQPLANSTKLNRTADQISNAIASNAGGQMGSLNGQLTIAQIQAIATALVSVTPPPPASDGATLYANNCQSCHGPLASSSKLNRTAAQITTAITGNAGGVMGALNNLTIAQVQLIADALVTTTPPPPVTDGATLYANYCASCHGQLANSTKQNRTAAQITSAITGNAGGVMGSISLTSTQIQAIANALVTTTPPPPVTDGATLYNTYCQSCHGPLATSSKLNRTSTQIQTAITNNAGGVMGSLSNLSAAQIQAIANVLVSVTPPPATDGATLYATYCQSCHGPLATSTKLNRTASQITTAITGNAGGVMGSLNGQLTSTQISAIATALASVTPVPTTGEGLYNTYCQACHGTGGRGGLYEGVRGASVSKINSAISSVSLMNSISLTSTQVQSISNYLNGITTTPPPTTTDGATLYGTYCQSCHGPLATSSKLNRTATQIQNAITSNAGGVMGSINLTSTQIQAIATALTSTAPPPPSTDGAALYGTYCQSCHGPLATSTKLNRSTTQIQTAINNNAGGVMGSLSNLTSAQVQAIATALASIAPVPTTGDGLYNLYCSSCHGAGGRGGQYESVRGASVSQITSAISKEPLMQSILLTSSQKQAISSYLSGSSGGGGD